MGKYVTKPFRPVGIIERSALSNNTGFYASFLIIAAFILSPFIALAIHDSQNSQGQAWVSITIGLYMAAAMLIISGFLNYNTKIYLSVMLMILACGCMGIVTGTPGENPPAKASAWTTIIFIAVVAIFVLVFLQGFSPENILRDYSIIGNYISKIDQILDHPQYVINLKSDNIPKRTDKALKDRREELYKIMHEISNNPTLEYRKPKNKKHDEIMTLLNDTDKELLGYPGAKKGNTHLDSLVKILGHNDYDGYNINYGADRNFFCGKPSGGGKAGGKTKKGKGATKLAKALAKKGSGCFLAGAMVSTPTGLMAIEQIKEGDMVYGYNTEGLVERSVRKTYRHKFDDNLLNIRHSSGVLPVTEGHNILVSQPGDETPKYIHASKLNVGDILFTGEGEESIISNIENGGRSDFVYNIDVDEVHNFTVEDIRVYSI